MFCSMSTERRMYAHQCERNGRSSNASTAQKVTRKYRLAAIRRREYQKLKAIVPSVSTRRTVSKLTVIEEAIKYIDKLHEALATRVNFHGTTSDGVCQQPTAGYLVDPDEFIRQLCFGSFRDTQRSSSDAALPPVDAGNDVISRHSRVSWHHQSTTPRRPPLCERQRNADRGAIMTPVGLLEMSSWTGTD